MELIEAEFSSSVVEQIDLTTVASKLNQGADWKRKLKAKLLRTTVAGLNIHDAFIEAARLFGQSARINRQLRTVKTAVSNNGSTVSLQSQTGLVAIAGIKNLHVAFEINSAPPSDRKVELAIETLQGVGHSKVEAKRNFLAVLFGLTSTEHGDIIRTAYQSEADAELRGMPLLFIGKQKPEQLENDDIDASPLWKGQVLQPTIPVAVRELVQPLLTPTQR